MPIVRTSLHNHNPILSLLEFESEKQGTERRVWTQQLMLQLHHWVVPGCVGHIRQWFQHNGGDKALKFCDQDLTDVRALPASDPFMLSECTSMQGLWTRTTRHSTISDLEENHQMGIICNLYDS